ncbi:hypothetical protein [Geodermatophilus sp. CPCC 205506]|uniref:hypothetical protein n=1 Tax=Geodermatophilus sp. CPCC 205506 TaxID=2936596 RepID=UPI003EEE4344
MATTGALIAAGFASRFTYQQVTIARSEAHALEAEAHERRKEQRQEQASHVTTWLDRDQHGRYLVWVYNASRNPVYDVVITFISPNNHNDFIGRQVVPPMQAPTVDARVSNFINEERVATKSIDLSWNHPYTNGPIKTLQDNPDGTKSWKADPEGWEAGDLGVAIAFTDTAGVRWERSLDGTLTERPEGFERPDGYILG